MLTPPFLTTAKHVHARVKTEQDYRDQHIAQMAKLKHDYPNMPYRGVWRSNDAPEPFVSGGLWQIECSTEGCGNCPAVAPGWGENGLALACCYDCGATYERIVMPAEEKQVEAELIKRKRGNQRYWTPDMTIQQLRDDNAKVGLDKARTP